MIIESFLDQLSVKSFHFIPPLTYTLNINQGRLTGRPSIKFLASFLIHSGTRKIPTYTYTGSRQSEST